MQRLTVQARFLAIVSVCCLACSSHALAAEIGGHVYSGAATFSGAIPTPIFGPSAATQDITDAKVMVQSQHSGGKFITYGALGPTASCPTCTANEWRAVVPDDGDYVIMFSAPGHDATSREVTVDGAGGVTHPKQNATGVQRSPDPLAIDAYLPPLYRTLSGASDPSNKLSPAGFLIYTFYDNMVNGEDDAPDDPPLNGVTVTARDRDGNVLAVGVTGTQATPFQLGDGTIMTNMDGLYYFTGLPPGEVFVSSDPSTAYLYDVNGPNSLGPITDLSIAAPLDFDAGTEFYLMSSEEGGQKFEWVLYPGDPGLEDGGYLAWQGFVRKLGQIGDPSNPTPYYPPTAGTVSGWLNDADMAFDAIEPGEALVPMMHPGVTANTIVADGLVVLFSDAESIPTHPIATVEADPTTGYFQFNNVPAGRYKVFLCDIPIDYVWVLSRFMLSPNEWVLLGAFEEGGGWTNVLVPRFFARVGGMVYDNSTGLGMPGVTVNIRYKGGAIHHTTVTSDGSDGHPVGWYGFDDMPEIEVLAYADAEPPPGFRGAMKTDEFYPDAIYRPLPGCNPSVPACAAPGGCPPCVDPGVPYLVTHNANSRYVQWYTANYEADLYLEPVPAGVGHLDGFVFYDAMVPDITWANGDGIHQSDEKTMHGVAVELWDATGTTLLATTTTGKFDKAAVLAQGWHEPYTIPPDEWGGVYAGPLVGYYEFREADYDGDPATLATPLVAGTYTVKMPVPAGPDPLHALNGFKATTPNSVTVVAVVGAKVSTDFGVNSTPPGSTMGVPLAGEIEGGVFDDLNVDPNPLSTLFVEKAGLAGVPVGVYDHLGYLLGVGTMGNPFCNAAASTCVVGYSLTGRRCMVSNAPCASRDDCFIGEACAIAKRCNGAGAICASGWDCRAAGTGTCDIGLSLCIAGLTGYQCAADSDCDIYDPCLQENYCCPSDEDPIQKPEMERRFAPGAHKYRGNDPLAPWDATGKHPGHTSDYPSLMLPYTFGQGKYKFEADWSLPPTFYIPGGVGALTGGFALPAGTPIVAGVTKVVGFVITGTGFGATKGFSTVTLAGTELDVISWSDTEIHTADPVDPVSGPLVVTTWSGPSNGVLVDVGYDLTRSVFVDASNTVGDGTQGNPFATIGEALANLPTTAPGTARYVFVAPGTYRESVQIAESDVYIIGPGPIEATVNAMAWVSPGGSGLGGVGPVFFIGQGGETGGVSNVMISGLTITGGNVHDDIGAGIFGDYGNTYLDINTCIIVQNGGYYGGGIWLHSSNHNVRIWSNTFAENGNWGGYGGAISVNDEPEYGPEHGQPEHVWDDHVPGCPPGTYEIFNNHIYHNFSPDYGGGICLYEVKDHLQVVGNLIEENKADDHGGGAFFEDTGPIDVYGNWFLRNYCRDDGGAISFEDVGDDIASVLVYNNLFAENMADDCGENTARGGALAFDDTFHAEVFNNTIVDNIVAGSYDPVGGGIDSERNGHEYNGSCPDCPDIAPGYSDVKIYNNIITGNKRLVYEQPRSGDEEDLCYEWGINYVWTPDNLHVDNPALQEVWESQNNSESYSHVEYNILSEGEYSSRVGNISTDPLFVNAAGSNWRLTTNSPAINQAPAITAPQRDLARDLRLVDDGVVDMGAYEIGAVPDNSGAIAPLSSPVAVVDTGGPYTIECHGGAMTTIQLDGRGTNSGEPGHTEIYAWSTDCPGGNFDDTTSVTPVLTFTSDMLCPLICSVTLSVSSCSDWTDVVMTTVTLEDTATPVLSGVPVDETVECDSVPIAASPTASDICDPTPQITYAEVRADGVCPDTYTLSRTWTATDACGNSSSQTQVIEVQDTVAPLLVVPSDLTVECIDSTDPVATGLATATDNCDAAPAVTYTDTENLTGCNGTGTITRRWTATDACGNSTTLNQVITVVDTIAPALTVAVDVTVECSEATDPSHTGQSTGTDCNAAPVITYTDIENLTGCNGTGTITRSWTATDACGNSTTLDQVITVVDSTAPVLTTPSDLTVECTDPAATGMATATDNCEASPVVSYIDTENLTGCNGTGTITRSWTATDACGNSTTLDQVITVVDTTAPSLTVAADVTIECTDPTDPTVTGQATATDNCDAAPVVSYTDTENLTGCNGTGTITRSWTATDACGNSTTLDQVITVVDTIAPGLTVAADVTIECSEATDPSHTGQSTGTDCNEAPTISYTDTENLTGCNGTGTITRSWTATDACGNSTTLDQVVTVIDTTPPVLTTPSDLTLECTNPTDPADTGLATATDNCEASPVVSYIDTDNLTGCNGTGTITRSWTATDACGNQATGMQTITVQDTVAPEIICPANLGIMVGDSTDPTSTGSASATDSCDGSPGIIFSDIVSAPLQFCPTVTEIARTWTATDACSNSSTCDQVIQVTDLPVPPDQCCNPANGVLTTIDDGDDCTGDLCDPLTGQVTHTNNGLCGACCLVDKACMPDVLEGTCSGFGGRFVGRQSVCLGDTDSDGIDEQCDNCNGADDAIFGVKLCTATGVACTDDSDCDNGDICEKACLSKIPTVSEWGLVILALVLLVGGKVCFGRRKSLA